MINPNIDTLVLLVVSETQSKKLMGYLHQEHFYFTIIDSANSLFREATICLLLGLNANRLALLNELVNEHCQPYRVAIPMQLHADGQITHLPLIESQEGGAMIYGLPVEYFEQI